jgi:hypothetical protein
MHKLEDVEFRLSHDWYDGPILCVERRNINGVWKGAYANEFAEDHDLTNELVKYEEDEPCSPDTREWPEGIYRVINGELVMIRQLTGSDKIDNV